MLALSDWVVVTAPLTPDTRGLLDRRRISLMKEGVYVIAVSRGNIIDEEALIEGLRSGHIAGAGLDVMSVEPLPEDSPLWDMDNVILTPHSAAVSPDRSIRAYTGVQGKPSSLPVRRAVPVRLRQGGGVLEAPSLTLPLAGPEGEMDSCPPTRRDRKWVLTRPPDKNPC